MKVFHYCIWLKVKNPETIYKSQFPLHVTLQKEIETYKEAVKNFEWFKEQIKKPIHVKCETIVNEIEDDFRALYYNVVTVKKEPTWWIDNAHISFEYKYGEIVKQEKYHENLQDSILELDTLSIYECNGHFKDWKEITAHKLN